MKGRHLNRWWTVGAGVVANAFGAGTIMVFAYGIMVGGLLAEYAWTRAEAGALFSAFLIGNGVGVALLGWLISRWGIRLPSVILAGIYGISFAAIAILPPNFPLFFVVFLIIGVGSAACTPLPYSVAISAEFDDRRGLALAIVVAASSVTSPLFPYVAEMLTSEFGWRSNFIAFGLVPALASFAALTFFVRTPPGAVVSSREAQSDIRPGREIYYGNRAFWLIGGAILAVSIACFGGMSSLVGYLLDRGYDGALVASIVSVSAIAMLCGKLVVGYLLDRIHAPLLAAIIFTASAAGFVFLLTASGPLSAFVGACCIAIALGSEGEFLTYLISRYFPLVEFSRVTGVIWVGWAWGGGLGAAIAASFLAKGFGYEPAFVLFAGLLVAGGAMLMFLGPYRDPKESDLALTAHPEVSRQTLD